MKVLLEEFFRTLLHELMMGNTHANDVDIEGLLEKGGKMQKIVDHELWLSWVIDLLKNPAFLSTLMQVDNDKK